MLDDVAVVDASVLVVVTTVATSAALLSHMFIVSMQPPELAKKFSQHASGEEKIYLSRRLGLFQAVEQKVKGMDQKMNLLKTNTKLIMLYHAHAYHLDIRHRWCRFLLHQLE